MRQKLTKVGIAWPAILDLVRQGVSVAGMAKALRVHRSTVYRWRAADPEWHQVERERIRREGAAAQAAFEARHEARKRELRPVRQDQAARARAAKYR
jgi:IS30 family transposase